jgi:hypothetical protein
MSLWNYEIVTLASDILIFGLAQGKTLFSNHRVDMYCLNEQFCQRPIVLIFWDDILETIKEGKTIFEKQ